MTTEGTTRREMLRRGALVGGAAIWAVPAVQALTMTAAHAATTSGSTTGGGTGGGNTGGGGTTPIGGTGGGSGTGPTPVTGVGGGGTVVPVTTGGGASGGSATGGTLPRTGFERGPLLEIGTVATAAGIGLVALGRKRPTDGVDESGSTIA